MKLLGMVVLIGSVAMSSGSVLAQAQLQLNERVGHSLKLANHDLAAAIQSYRSRLRGAQLALFDNSQVAWEASRRATFDFESSGVSGGSVQPMVMSGCLERIARERLRYIESLSTCEEGDLNCRAWNKGI